MKREEAIHKLSTAMNESKDIVERIANYIESLPIVNYNENMSIPIKKPNRKSYESPYAKFDRIKKKRR